MDCSTSAVQRHFELADEAMTRALAPAGAVDAVEQLRAYSMTIDVPAFFRAQQAVRRRRRWALLALAAIGLVAVAVAAGWWFTRGMPPGG
jgi:hypothetical protein